MQYLGIDYGTKNVGLAYCDDTSAIAFPLAVLPSGAALVEEVSRIARERGVAGIVMGESKSYTGAENPVMSAAKKFATALGDNLNVPIYWEPEFLTSREAQRGGGEPATLDASAAALILQSFLDKRRRS